jgi:MerR family copper efflux transcriptional regulator
MLAMNMIELSELTQTPVSTLHYFESINLLSAVLTPNGDRHYDDESLAQVGFIRKAQRLGFSLDEILQISIRSRIGQPPCQMLQQMLQQKIATLDERMRELQQMRQTLNEYLARASQPEGQGDLLYCGLMQFDTR